MYLPHFLYTLLKLEPSPISCLLIKLPLSGTLYASLLQGVLKVLPKKASKHHRTNVLKSLKTEKPFPIRLGVTYSYTCDTTGQVYFKTSNLYHIWYRRHAPNYIVVQSFHDYWEVRTLLIYIVISSWLLSILTQHIHIDINWFNIKRCFTVYLIT